MGVKSLKTLLAQADQFCSGPTLSKTASAQESEVSALASILAGAETDLTIHYDPQALKQDEIDKIAESLNRVQTAAEIDTVLKLSEFEKKAQLEGYTAEQINEAFSKIAASSMTKSMPLLIAMGLVPPSSPEADKNSLPKKPDDKPSQKQLLGALSLTRSVGY